MKRNILLFCLLTIPLHLNCSLIVNKLAFFPDNSYTLPPSRLPPGATEQFVPTSDGIKLQCYLIRNPDSKYLLLYFHGNAGNIAQRVDELAILSKMGLNVLGIGYRGYGKSEGRPSEAGIYRDGESAIIYAQDSLGFSLQNIFVFGQSIGTTAAVHTACDKDIAGLVLVTPLTTGKAYVKAHGLGLLALIARKAFDNSTRINRVKCPVLIIHGTHDRTIPYFMGRQLYAEVPTQKELVTIEGGDHNDLPFVDGTKYWNSIHAFVTATMK